MKILKSVEKRGLDIADTILLSSLTVMEIILTCFQTTRINVHDVKTDMYTSVCASVVLCNF